MMEWVSGVMEMTSCDYISESASYPSTHLFRSFPLRVSTPCLPGAPPRSCPRPPSPAPCALLFSWTHPIVETAVLELILEAGGRVSVCVRHVFMEWGGLECGMVWCGVLIIIGLFSLLRGTIVNRTKYS